MIRTVVIRIENKGNLVNCLWRMILYLTIKLVIKNAARYCLTRETSTSVNMWRGEIFGGGDEVEERWTCGEIRETKSAAGFGVKRRATTARLRRK